MEIVVPDEFKHLYVTNASRPILKVPHPTLRATAKEVERVAPRHKVLADTMTRLMKEANGVGLAAPQIGVLERMIVICPDDRPLVLINPSVTSSEGDEVGEEGCLSIPGLYGDVHRSTTVEVAGFDRKGRAVSYTMRGIAARVVLHEIDHLDGVLFTDRVDPATLHWIDPAQVNDS